MGILYRPRQEHILAFQMTKIGSQDHLSWPKWLQECLSKQNGELGEMYWGCMFNGFRYYSMQTTPKYRYEIKPNDYIVKDRLGNYFVYSQRKFESLYEVHPEGGDT